MANNTGFLLMAGLGALLFLGRGAGTKTVDEDSRLLAGQGGGGPMPPAFNLQSYVDSLFGDMATVPVQPPVTFLYPQPVVVTSSGVPAVVHTAPEIITPTTKVQIGGDGGQTIVASSLAIIQQEQFDKQRFQAAANVQTPKTEATRAFNRDEEARQMALADRLVKAARDAQAKRNAAIVAKTREQQENIARGLNPDGSPKTLPSGMSVIVAGQPVVVFGQDDEFWAEDEQAFVVSAPGYSDTFVISGGMDSPGPIYSESFAVGGRVDSSRADSPTYYESTSAFAFGGQIFDSSEYDDPGPDYYAPSIYTPSATVHEVTAAYDIGF